jgi:DNA-binding CsgD family transcriptional regulator
LSDNSHISSDGTPIFHNEYVKIWEDVNKKSNDEPLVKKYEELSTMIGEYAKLNNQFVSIFNTKSQRVMYMSDNYLDVLGYACTEEDYKRWSTFYWMRDLPFAQSWFFMQMSLFFKSTVQPELKKAGNSKSLTWYMHNFRLKHSRGVVKNISLTGSGLELTNDGSMVVMMLVIKDIAPLINEKNTWWAQFLINGEEKYFYHPDDGKIKKGMILSNREVEILMLIAQKKESKQIAELLNISPQTVDKHRKNMLEMTGAKDISSLMQICEIGNII